MGLAGILHNWQELPSGKFLVNHFSAKAGNRASPAQFPAQSNRATKTPERPRIGYYFFVARMRNAMSSEYTGDLSV